jgi:glycosidase
LVKKRIKPVNKIKYVPFWVKDAIFYEIFPDRFANGNNSNDPPNTEPWGGVPTRKNFFGGDLQGIIDKLNYLESLGVNALYLTPIFTANTNHKYDIVDYYQVDSHFGNQEIFHKLLESAHARGIRIVLDAVFDHVGDNFWAFRDVVERGEASPHVNWFYIEDLPVITTPTPNYATYENAHYLVKLNIHNPELRKYLYDVARYWTKKGIDGWRLDVPYLMNHNFWKGFRRVVKEINPELYIVGEIWEKSTDWLQGDECDGAMNYQLRDLIIDFFVSKKLNALTFDQKLNTLRKENPGDTVYSMLNLLGSHDTPRFLTLCQGNKQIFKLGVSFLLTYIGAPMIYYGDEIGMTGENDPGCRGPMIWEDSKQDKELLEFHHQLICIRKAHSALRQGTFRTVLTSYDVYAFERQYNTDQVIVIFNRGNKTRSVNLPEKYWRGKLSMRDELSGQIYESFKPIKIKALSTLILSTEFV